MARSIHEYVSHVEATHELGMPGAGRACPAGVHGHYWEVRVVTEVSDAEDGVVDAGEADTITRSWDRQWDADVWWPRPEGRGRHLNDFLGGAAFPSGPLLAVRIYDELHGRLEHLAAVVLTTVTGDERIEYRPGRSDRDADSIYSTRREPLPRPPAIVGLEAAVNAIFDEHNDLER